MPCVTMSNAERTLRRWALRTVSLLQELNAGVWNSELSEVLPRLCLRPFSFPFLSLQTENGVKCNGICGKLFWSRLCTGCCAGAALVINTYLIMREIAICGLGCFANQWFYDTVFFNLCCLPSFRQIHQYVPCQRETFFYYCYEEEFIAQPNMQIYVFIYWSDWDKFHLSY